LNSITNFSSIRFKNTQKETTFLLVGEHKPEAEAPVTKPAIQFGSGILVVLIIGRATGL